MSGRAIRGNIQLETDSIGPTVHEGGTIQKSRAEYFPVLPDHSECNNLFIVMTFHNETELCKLTNNNNNYCLHVHVRRRYKGMPQQA